MEVFPIAVGPAITIRNFFTGKTQRKNIYSCFQTTSLKESSGVTSIYNAKKRNGVHALQTFQVSKTRKVLPNLIVRNNFRHFKSPHPAKPEPNGFAHFDEHYSPDQMSLPAFQKQNSELVRMRSYL